MECKIDKIVNNTTEYGLLKVSLKLTEQQLNVLRTIINNSAEDYDGNGNPDTNFYDVISKAYYKI